MPTKETISKIVVSDDKVKQEGILIGGGPCAACGDGILGSKRKRRVLRPGLCHDSPARTLVVTTAMSATGVPATVSTISAVSTVTASPTATTVSAVTTA